MNDDAQSATLHDRVSGLETGLEKILSLLQTVAPVASFIPGAAPIIAGVEAVGDVAEHAFRAIDGTAEIDGASLAAGAIAHSTGNGSLDARLAQIEMYMELASPLLQYIAREFGMTAPAPFVSPAMQSAQAVIQDSTGAA